jgi:hypothetical protein
MSLPVILSAAVGNLDGFYEPTALRQAQDCGVIRSIASVLKVDEESRDGESADDRRGIKLGLEFI